MEKPLTFFLNNMVKNGSLSLEKAQELNSLASPHLQFEAVMALKKERAISPCNGDVSLPQTKTSFMSNRRWIDVAVLGVAIPLIHSYWVRTPELKKSVKTPSVFASAQPVVFVARASAENTDKRPAFHPKNEGEALNHFLREPVLSTKPVAYELSMGAQAEADAETAALEAMPITTRR